MVPSGAGDGAQTIPVLQPALDALSNDPLLALAGALAAALVLAILSLALLRRRRSSRVPKPA